MMELLWTPEAVRDREDIYDYIEEDNPLAALALDDLIAERTAVLLGFPRMGRGGAGGCRAPLNWSFTAATWSCMTLWKHRCEY